MIISLLIWIAAFTIAITIHEAAHAWMADRLGDPTPKIMGRLSLNPLVHYDPIGTTLLLGLVIMRAFGAPVIPFGWAKPVEFDPLNLKNPRRDAALISLAGPASNLIFALMVAFIVRLLLNPFSIIGTLSVLAYPLVTLNVILAIFNLIPFHPLDGGKILVGLLPREEAYEAEIFLRKYSTIILMCLIIPFFGGNSAVSYIISPIIKIVTSLLLPASYYL